MKHLLFNFLSLLSAFMFVGLASLWVWTSFEPRGLQYHSVHVVGAMRHDRFVGVWAESGLLGWGIAEMDWPTGSGFLRFLDGIPRWQTARGQPGNYGRAERYAEFFWFGRSASGTLVEGPILIVMLLMAPLPLISVTRWRR